MADHNDEVRYGVQRGDGVFTPRSDVQLVADRGARARVCACACAWRWGECGTAAGMMVGPVLGKFAPHQRSTDHNTRIHTHTAYPTPGVPYWNTYGPGLSSASKLYSFGYLETIALSLTPDASDDGGRSSGGAHAPPSPNGGDAGTVPLQGTALFVVGLKDEGEELRCVHQAIGRIAGWVGLLSTLRGGSDHNPPPLPTNHTKHTHKQNSKTKHTQTGQGRHPRQCRSGP
jgi:hypothetical protein